MQDVTVSKKFI